MYVKRKSIVRKLKRISRVLFVTIMSMTLLLSGMSTVSIATDDKANIDVNKLRILEIQPSTSFDITSQMKDDLGKYLDSTIELTQMPMPLLVSKIEQINGYYDIVYIGNNQNGGDAYNNYYGGKSYSQFGPKVGNDFYSGNDITNKSAENIKSFLESGQLAIFDSGIFETGLATTKLSTNFKKYKTYSNVDCGITSGNTNNLMNYLKDYQTKKLNKRPTLKIVSSPEQYNGSNVISNGGVLNFVLNVANNNSSDPMKIKFFVDKNGNGLYEDTEMNRQFDNVGNVKGYSMNIFMPQNFTGLVPWKVEAIDKFGVKSYVTGDAAYKSEELQIRVLQLLSNNGATFRLSTLANYNGQNLLYKAGQYNIKVTEMSMATFNANYGSLVSGQPTILNGNYDMVIVGFDDSYAGDLSGAALNSLVAFADSNQSIMFTHDTIGFSSTNLSNAFRSRLGFAPFATDQSVPSGVSNPRGATRLGLFNGNGMPRFPDTVSTKKINESTLTKYPYILGDIKVSPTHLQYIRLDMEDPSIITSFTYKNENIYAHASRGASLVNPVKPETLYHEYDGANDYYTFSRGSLSFSGTGHSYIDSFDEMKMFINTIIKASIGANHAPNVKILGISNNQDVANTIDNLDFSVLASDYEDKKLSVKIFIDKNGNGYYEEAPVAEFKDSEQLDSDIIKAVSVIKGVPTNVSRFGIKVVVVDSQNATGSAEIFINNKSGPTFNITNNAGSYLLNDVANIELKVVAQSTELKTSYSDLSLKTTLLQNACKSMSMVDWNLGNATEYTKNLENVDFTPLASINNQKSNIQFVCGATGTFSIPVSMTYKQLNSGSSVVNSNFNIRVKSGEVDAVVQDFLGRGIGGVSVTLNSYENAGNKLKTGFTPIVINTDNGGVAKFTGLQTGYYGVVIKVPDGYVDETTTVSKKADGILNYDNATQIITVSSLTPKIIVNGPDIVKTGILTKYSAVITPASYADILNNITWKINPSKGVATINSKSGVLYGIGDGIVEVIADTNQKDTSGNELTASKKVIVLLDSADVN